MINYLTHDLIIHLIFFEIVVLIVILSNLLILHHSRKHRKINAFPLVSILVPVRDEEKNIERCVLSLLAQNYPNFEVIVLDDQSQDNTPVILNQLAQTQPLLRVLRGSPPKDNLSGKNWACDQLAQQAKGDIFFFTDADTIHQPQALLELITALSGEKADLLTGFPRQQILTWGEALLVPFFNWASISFLPLFIAYRIKLPGLSTAVGQVMIFKREAYQKIGGHAALGNIIIDDLTLTRRIKAAGLRWRVVNLTDLVSCRMYHGMTEAVEGFTKNLFAAFDFHMLPYIFSFFWLAILFCLPFVVLIFHGFGTIPAANTGNLLVCIGLSLLIWSIPYAEIKIPLGFAFLYPITVLANEVIAFRSLLFSLTGRLSWKGRPLERPKWKWF